MVDGMVGRKIEQSWVMSVMSFSKKFPTVPRKNVYIRMILTKSGIESRYINDQSSTYCFTYSSISNSITMPSTPARHDRFFLWKMVFLPLLSMFAYLFDAYFHYINTFHTTTGSIYEGLFSTIVLLFFYVQYCVPIKSIPLRCAYHLLLWILNEIGHVGYFLTYLEKRNTFSAIIFIGWMILDILFILGMLYCRVYRELDHKITVENKHIFHFISRLDVIIALCIPIYISKEYNTPTRDNIAFFILFDFFSESYERFKGGWIKSCLYLFAGFVTVSVAGEWLYVVFKGVEYEQITEITELVAGGLCYALIIMQFFAYHFKPQPDQNHTPELNTNAVSTISMSPTFWTENDAFFEDWYFLCLLLFQNKLLLCESSLIQIGFLIDPVSFLNNQGISTICYSTMFRWCSTILEIKSGKIKHSKRRVCTETSYELFSAFHLVNKDRETYVVIGAMIFIKVKTDFFHFISFTVIDFFLFD